MNYGIWILHVLYYSWSFSCLWVRNRRMPWHCMILIFWNLWIIQFGCSLLLLPIGCVLLRWHLLCTNWKLDEVCFSIELDQICVSFLSLFFTLHYPLLIFLLFLLNNMNCYLLPNLKLLHSLAFIAKKVTHWCSFSPYH